VEDKRGRRHCKRGHVAGLGWLKGNVFSTQAWSCCGPRINMLLFQSIVCVFFRSAKLSHGERGYAAAVVTVHSRRLE
jgi:hypothetical protein